MKAFSATTTMAALPTAIATSLTRTHETSHTRRLDSCPPSARYVKLQSTTGSPISMFEVVVSDTSSELNLADPADNPDAVASQSSTLSGSDASFSVDGDGTTFSETNHVALGDASPWWQVDLGRSYDLSLISIKNRWCDSVDDVTGCLCGMSQAYVYLIDDHGVEFYSENLGDTCGKTDLTSGFMDNADFCPEKFTSSTIAALENTPFAICVDNEDFVSVSGLTCSDLDGVDPSEQFEMCNEPGNYHSLSDAGGEGGTSDWYPVHQFCPASCNKCVPSEDAVSSHDQSFASGVGPTVSMSDAATAPGKYIAPTTSAPCTDDQEFVSDSGLTCFDLGSAELMEKYEMCNEPGTADQRDENGNAYPVKYYCCTECTGSDFELGIEPTAPFWFDTVNTPGEVIFSTMPPGGVIFSTLPASDQVGGGLTDMFGTQEQQRTEPPVVMYAETTPPAQSVDLLDTDVIGYTAGGEVDFPTARPVANPSTEYEQFSAQSVDLLDTDVIGYTAGGEVDFPTARPVANPSTEYEQFSGHSYSMGDKCEDDPTFISDKGITCISFVYAETVHCRSPTGKHDKDLNALRYEDFCPKTCGMCSAKAVDTSMADENAKLSIEVEDAEGVALGVGLAVAITAVLLVCAMCCQSKNKSSLQTPDSGLSEGRGQDADGVGGVNPSGYTDDPGENIDVKVTKMEIV